MRTIHKAKNDASCTGGSSTREIMVLALCYIGSGKKLHFCQYIFRSVNDGAIRLFDFSNVFRYPHKMIPDISQCSYCFHTNFLVELGND